ncbi:DUF4411 family protein [Gemmatimonas sp.]|jgi:hypothetical protein|uniref:DUF4411 family protein n=1 Tax=Gemmatimonas sp. TaxID=1962908 RepID=UPI0022BAD562|nr:DUF4411 family protein [Gemmatimonas sp.]MCZ8203407.1 DUF4411 family protein [Gemmatimonas sp.]
MAYLLDANVLIAAKRDHYRFKTFPCYWDYLLQRANDGALRSVDSVRKELLNKEDDLSQWVESACPKVMFEAPDGATGVALSRLGIWTMDPQRKYTPAARAEFLNVADSVLVAHALAHEHTVVTHEKPEPQRIGKVKIPDACSAMGVRWIDPYALLEELGAKF